ncbi:Metallo-dependent phosphatase [Mycena sanguinolenta]|uniref:Metallo-dependent phosphatase n=1 Tax=Mycena sanguinolenta TaxID=230812 RepID=A0A8H7D512_9AGAR|nr:Metallo-dependent phosphatase [Mycena sanguinolenta]
MRPRTALVFSLAIATTTVSAKFSLGSRDTGTDYFNICVYHSSFVLCGPSDFQTGLTAIYHVNDIHAHLDEITTSGTDCTKPESGCYGGYARIKAAVDAGRATVNNSLFLNMGDEFQGTLFYSYYGGEIIADTLNQLNFDAMTLGNHEFDQGDAYLGQFLNNLTIPIVCANVDSQDKTINSTVKPYHVFPQYKLAVVAVTTDTIPTISNSDKSTTFADPIETMQYWADYVYAHEDVERIIAMTHIGYEDDIAMAQNTTGIHLIIGGHSHTLLGDMAGAAGPYPTIETNLDGEEVFVVTAYRYGEYLGYLDVQFDPTGKIVGLTGGPIHLTNQTAQDADLEAQIKAWRVPFDAFGNEVIGNTTVLLNHNGCKTGEWCMLNGGGIRVDIPVGNVTRGDVINAFPFGNAVTEVSLSGRDLWNIFAGAVAGVSVFNGAKVVTWPQISQGVRVTYNPTTKTLIDLEVGQGDEMVTVDFGATYLMSDYVVLDTLDEVLTAYIQRLGSVDEELQNRVVPVNDTTPVQS